jgi:hypothetical protein
MPFFRSFPNSIQFDFYKYDSLIACKTKMEKYHGRNHFAEWFRMCMH